MFRPDHQATHLHTLSLDDLAAQGVLGLIVDLDNTLVGYGKDALEDTHTAWIADARARGFGVVLVSNNFSERVARIGRELGVPAIPSALKPLPRGFLRALRVLGTPRERTVVVGDQLFTDVLGAKLVGLRCVLVEPLVPHDWLGTRILRFFERVLHGRRSLTR